MEYYEKIHQINKIPGYYFKIKKNAPTKIFAMSMSFSSAVKGTANMDTYEKVADFLVENILFSKTAEGEFKLIKMPGLDSYELTELDNHPEYIQFFLMLYFKEVIQPQEKH